MGGRAQRKRDGEVRELEERTRLFRDPRACYISQYKSATVVIVRNALWSDTQSQLAICNCGGRRITSIYCVLTNIVTFLRSL
jgi:hypothetical protein